MDGGGRKNKVELCLTACYFEWDRARIIKPPCNFHFWFLTLFYMGSRRYVITWGGVQCGQIDL